jgi:hypothetical protein
MTRIENFVVDENLMYLIQQVTGDTTEDILFYFFNLASSIIEETFAKSRARQYHRTLGWHYRSTAVPYKLEIYGSWMDKSKIYVGVKFPQSRSDVDVATMVNNLVERGLQLDNAESLPKFENPKTKIPQGFKRLLHD